MFSSTSSWIIFGVIALVAVVVIWKWWNKPKDDSKKNEDAPRAEPQISSTGGNSSELDIVPYHPIEILICP